MNRFTREKPFLTDIDVMISHIRRVQELQGKIDQNRADFEKTGEEILIIFKHLIYHPGTKLTGIIEYEMEYQIWADENDKLHLLPLKALLPILTTLI